VIAAMTFSARTPFPGYAALLPTLGTALVIAAGVGSQQSRTGVGRLLAVSPLRYVGDRSYAFYLWHWPVLIIAIEYEGSELTVGIKLLLLLGAFLLSIISYRVLENPIRRARWSTARSAMLIPVSAAVVVAVTMVTLAVINAKILQLEKASASAASSATQSLPDRRKGSPKPLTSGGSSGSQGGASRREDSFGAHPTGLRASP
jgi:peptidoglycan/LPS O-acetylase OafA/YrhL